MSKLPVAGRFSLVNELQDSFSSHTVLYGHAGHRPMEDSKLALSEGKDVDMRRPESDDEVYAEVTSVSGVSPGGRAVEPMLARMADTSDSVASEGSAGSGGEDGLGIRYTGSVTSLDESADLQNAALGTTSRDRDDHDTHVDALPAAFSARLVQMGLGNPAHAALSGFDGFIGGSAFEFDTESSTIVMTLVDDLGQSFNGKDSGLRTVTGESIYLYSDPQNPAIVYGTTDLGDVVFAVYLEHTENSVHGGALWSILYQPLEHPDPMDHDEAVDLSGLVFAKVSTADGQALYEIPSGNHLFFMVGDAANGYVVTGKKPADQSAGQQINKGDTVNVSQANGTSSLGVNNQMIDPEGEGLFITFVTDPNPAYTGSQLSQTEADREANIQFGQLRSATSAYFMVSQTQPAVRDATVEVAAWQTNAGSGASFISGSVVNAPVAIDRVRVLDRELNVLEDSDGSVDTTSISIEIVNGVATVTGVKPGYWIEYRTDGDHNRMSITNPDAGKSKQAAAFDVGGFSTGIVQTQTVEVGQLLQFEDDAPVIGAPVTDYIETQVVDVDGEPQTLMRQSGAMNFDFGADGNGGFRWLESGAPEGFSYVTTGNMLDIYQGDVLLMSVEFDSSTGHYEATQHTLATGAPGSSLELPLVYEIVDRDGDSAVGQLALVPEMQIMTFVPPTLNVNGNRVALDESNALQNLASSSAPGDQDDNDISSSELPASMLDRLQALGAGIPAYSALSGYDGTVGKPITTFTGDVSALTGFSFSDAIGMPLDGDDSGLFTVTGEPIYLYTDGLDPALLLGKTAGGDVVLAAYLDAETSLESGVMLWTALYEPLQHPDPSNPDEAVDLTDRVYIKTGSEATYDLSDVKPGQYLFFMTGNENAALVYTGKNPANQSAGEPVNGADTVNPSAATTTTVGVNNQMIDAPTYDKFGEIVKPAEGVIVSFVSGANPAYTGVNLSPGEAVVEANIQFSSMIDALQAKFVVSQLQPVKSATVQVSAWHSAAESGTQFVDGLLVDDTQIAVSRVIVYDNNGVLLEDSNGSVVSSDIEITIIDGVATIAGVNPGYQIEYFTGDAHNRVLIENAGSRNANLNASFDLGAFTLVQTNSSVAEIGSAMVFEDDGVDVGPNATVFLDDEALANGNPGGTGDQDPDLVAVTGTLNHTIGNDQPGSIAWLTEGAPAGFTYEASGTDLLVKQGSTTVMTLSLDSATGAYSVVQNAAIMHEAGMYENDQSFTVGYRVTDADGDSTDGSLSITVDDDTPVVTENATVYLDDDAMAGGNAGGIGDQDPDQVSTTGVLSHSFGADQPGSIAWLTDGAPAGFTYETSGTDLLVKQGAVTVLTLSLDATTGAYAVTQNAAIQHEPGMDENDTSFRVGYRVTDADGDFVDGSISIEVDDDTPVVTENATVYLDDDAMAGGNAGGIGDQDPDRVSTTGVLSHSYGADQPGSIAWLTEGAPAGFTYETSGTDLLVKQGAVTVMTLSLDSMTGAYSVVQNAAIMHEAGMDENDQSFTVSYRVTDADGDSTDGSLSITVDDDTPVVTENATVYLDDDAMVGGNAGGIGDQDPDVVAATGTLSHSFGADQPGSIAWLTDGAPAGFTYEASGSDLLVKQGAVTVMTLSLDSMTGAYSVVQNAAILHEAGMDENDTSFRVGYRVTDADGDFVDGSISIEVDDDTPVVSENATVYLDDDAMAGGNAGGIGDQDPDVVAATGTLSHSFGADQPGSIVWLTDGAPAGFTYEASGTDLLVKQGAVTVMTLSLDSITGAYSVVQNAAILHEAGMDENDTAFRVGYRVTDADGDFVDGSISIEVDDDAPVVSENATVYLDDDALANGNPGGVGDQDPDVVAATGTLSHAFGADQPGSIAWLTEGAPAGFTYEASGSDLLVKQGSTTVMTLSLDSATGAYAVVQNAAILHQAGMDENDQSFTVGYRVTDADGDSTDGSLSITVDDDTPVVSENATVYLDDDAMAGGNAGGIGDQDPDVVAATGTLSHSFGADQPGSIAWLTEDAPAGFTYEASGTDLLVKQGAVTVMTLSLDSMTGAYSVVQNAAIMHEAGMDENDTSFRVGYRVTDADGDFVDGSISIEVDDDTPLVSENAKVYLDDDAMAGGNAGGIGDQDPDVVAATGTLSHAFGADQPGSIAWLTDGAPAGFTYEASGSDLLVKQGAVTVLTLSLDATTGAYAITQNAAILHEAGMDENDQSFTVGYRVTDADGDSTDGSLSIMVDDDTPVVTENATVYLDDDTMAGGNAGGIGDQDPDVVAATGTLSHAFGADQPGSIAWLTDGAPAGFTYETSGTDLLVKQGSTTVMTLSLDSATGAYAVTQNAAILHEAGMDENDQSFTVSYRVTDADGDSTDGSLSITVDDDTPVVSENAKVYLDDDAMAGGNAGGIGDQDPDVVAATGTLSHSFGADQPGSIAWLTEGAPAGFTYEASGTDLLVKQGAVTVLTLSLDAMTGAYAVTQNAAILHEAGMDENDTAFRVGYRVTDADGDFVDGSISIEVDDDTPVVSENATVYLDDDAMAGGNAGGIGDQDPDVVAATGTLSHSFGADQPGSIAWLNSGAPAGFTYEVSGTDLLVKQGSTTVMTLSLDSATGDYAVVQNAAILHEAGLNENDQSFTVSYRVTDADGDFVDGSISIEVDDDTPVVSENATVYLDDDAMAGGNAGGIGDQDPDVVAATGTLSHSFGADQPGSIAWLTDGAPAGFTYEASGTDLLVKQGAVTVLTLSLDATTGAYAVTQNAAILHEVGMDENETSFRIGYRVTDADGDFVDGSISIEVDDDTPAVSENAAVYLDDDAMAGGNAGGIGDQDPDQVSTTGVLSHSFGADQPGSIAWLTEGAPAGFTYEASGTDLLVKQGSTTVMTLSLDSATGAYAVTQNAAIMHEAGMDENDQSFIVGYRVTDADGDSTDGSLSIMVDDDTPVVSENATVYLDDDAMAGGNAGGIGDQDPDVVAATGTLSHAFGADQPGSIAWLTDGAPAGFTYEASGTDLLVKQGAVTVMTLSLDSMTGAYSVVQNAAIMHEAGMDENDTAFRIGYRVTDADGDFVDGSISIEVDDDTPVVSENATVYLDDDTMAGGNAGGIGDQNPDVVAATGTLSHSFGADQPGSIAWLTDGAPAGFTYEASGSDLLVKQGAVTVMTLSLDSITGAYAVTQNAAILHEAGMDENDTSFRVGYRVTDADGDFVDGSISIEVDDDTPVVSENATVYLDDDAMAGGNAGGIGDQDPDVVAATGTLSHAFGADQPGSIAWLTDGAPAGFTYETSGTDLLVKQGSTTVMTLSLDLATGAYAVTQNAAILHEAGMDENDTSFRVGYRVTDADGDFVDGSISIEVDDDTPVVSENAKVYLDDDAMAGGNAGGIGDQDPDVVAATGTLSHSFGADQPGSIAWLTEGAPAGFTYEASGSDLLVKQGAVTVMTLSLDSMTGAYSVVQNAAIMHEAGMDENDTSFRVGYRVTDADGDFVDGSISIEVDDDTPVVSENATVYLDDDAMAGGNAGGISDQDPDMVAATGTLSHSFGADQPGSIAWLTEGAPAGFTYEASGSDLLVKQGAVTVLTLSLDATTGAYSVVQNAAMRHESGMDENDTSFRVGYRVTDADGDFVDGSISIEVDDDTPVVSENATVYLDDDAMAGGNAGGIGDQDPDVVAATGTLSHSFGADQPGSIAWLTGGAPAGFTYEASGTDLLVKQGAVTVLTLSLDATTGAYAVTQNAAILHEAGMDENDQSFTVGYRVTDADGDSTDGSLSITVDDDTPVVSENATVYLDDDAMAGGNAGGIGDQDPDVVAATGTLSHAFGADQPGSIAWLTDGAPAGFTYEASGSDLLVKQGSTTVMTLSLDSATGDYAVVQNAAIMHEAGMDENETSFRVGYRVTDADGDFVDGSISIEVDDDTPVVSENATVYLDDDAMAGGNAGGIGDQDPDVVAATGTLSHAFGANQPGSIAWLNSGAPAGFTYEASGTDLLVKQGAVTVLTLSLDSLTGAYSVVQNAPILHEAGMDENDTAFRVGYRVTDADGDFVDGSISIEVDDDTPVVSENATVYLDDDAMAGGNAGGIGDQDPDQVSTTGVLSHSYGADQPGSIAWLTDGAPAGFSYETSGTDLLVKQGSTIVMTLSLDSATGAYAVIQNAAILHEAGMDENDTSFRVGYRVADADGDFVDGSISIEVDDDTPVVSENATVYLDDDAMAGGNAGGVGDQDPDMVAATGTLSHSFGADQPGSIAWLTDGAPVGFTYEASGSNLLVKQGAATVLTLSLDATTGAYSVVQNAAIMHEAGQDENDTSFRVGYRVSDADGDFVDGVLNLVVNDDTPTVSGNATVLLDDDALTGGNPGGIDDQDPDVVGATGVLGHSYGADQPGSIAWLTGGAPAGFTYEASGTDLLVKQGAVTVLTLSLDSMTGAYSVVQNAPVQHATAFNENDTSFEIGYRVSDADGDFVDGLLSISVDDDTPVVNEVTGATYFNSDNPVPGAFGVFDYSVGADSRQEYSATNTDLLMFRLTGTVGVNSITNSSITWVSESNEAALFRVGFDYQPSESSVDISSAAGYIAFDKVEGTYQFWLDEPLEGYSISTTSSALAFTGYEVNSETVDKTQPAVVVAQLTDSLYAQFTGYSEPGGGTGINNLQALGVDADPNTFVNGETFVQASSYVSVSNVANGVGGDTLQKAEVLNFTLYGSNPAGYLNQPATEYAESMFLKFDGIGTTEDLVVVLSLINPDTMAQTTRALIVDSTDILKFGNTITPEYRIVLDNNDGAIIIENNDFNAPGESYLITGAQVLVSVEGVAGEGIEFNSLIGEQGASTTTRAFGASETDSDVIKISDIGVMTQSSATLSAELQIDLAVIDTDFDASATQAIDISILGSAMAPLDTAV